MKEFAKNYRRTDFATPAFLHRQSLQRPAINPMTWVAIFGGAWFLLFVAKWRHWF